MKKKKSKDKPLGIILILVFLGFSFFSTIGSFLIPSFQIGNMFVTGTIANIIIAIVAIVLALSFYGLYTRKYWSYKLIIGWFIFVIVHRLSSLISYFINPDQFLDNFQKVFFKITPDLALSTQVSNFTIGLILSLSIILYLTKQKKYFE